VAVADYIDQIMQPQLLAALEAVMLAVADLLAAAALH
jgi:hypothetical protein